LDRRWPRAPERAAAAGLRGQLAEQAGNAPQALKELEQMAELNRGEARRAALGALVEAAARLSRRADEQRALERYLTEFPQAPDALARRIEQARLLAAGGDAAEARAALRALQAQADDEHAAEIQFRLGETAEAAKDLPGAILEYGKTPHLADRSRLDWDAGALFAAARCWEQLGRGDEAAAALRQVIALKGETSGHGQRAKAELARLGAAEGGVKP
jgi:tetratricopeptide (TPR) repeat protein